MFNLYDIRPRQLMLVLNYSSQLDMDKLEKELQYPPLTPNRLESAYSMAIESQYNSRCPIWFEYTHSSQYSGHVKYTDTR